MQYEYIDESAPFTEKDWAQLMDRMRGDRSSLYGQWVRDVPSPLDEMAKEYHSRCDAYDGEPDGSPEWLGNVNRHARQVRQELCQQWSITERQFHEAIVAYQRNGR